MKYRHKKPPTGSLQWSELKLALLGGGRVFLTWIVEVTQFKRRYAAARWQGQWERCLQQGAGEEAVSHDTARAGILFLLLGEIGGSTQEETDE